MAEDYVHRIGRTGRAGNEGEAMSLVCVDELKLLKDIERLIKRDIPSVTFEGYEPDPSIKAEPINNGRGSRSGNAKRGAPRKHGSSQRRSGQSASRGANGNRANGNAGQSQHRGR